MAPNRPKRRHRRHESRPSALPAPDPGARLQDRHAALDHHHAHLPDQRADRPAERARDLSSPARTALPLSPPRGDGDQRRLLPEFRRPAPTNKNAVWTQTGGTVGGTADLAAYDHAIHPRAMHGTPGQPRNAPCRTARRGPTPDSGSASPAAATPAPATSSPTKTALPAHRPPPTMARGAPPTSPKNPVLQLLLPQRFRAATRSSGRCSPAVRSPRSTTCVCAPARTTSATRSSRMNSCAACSSAPARTAAAACINTLYVNGVYKGYYNLCEHIREDFLQRHHGSDLAWDVRQVTTIASGDGLAFQEMITFLRNNPQSTLANYQGMTRPARYGELHRLPARQPRRRHRRLAAQQLCLCPRAHASTAATATTCGTPRAPSAISAAMSAPTCS